MMLDRIYLKKSVFNRIPEITLVNFKTNYLISLVSFVIWSTITYWGYTVQYDHDMLFEFSYGNTIIIVLNIFYMIALSQYLLLNDKAFLFYTFYLIFSIGYIHYTIFIIDNHYILEQPPYFIMHSPSILLFLTYWCYTMFTIHFLSLRETNPDVEQKLKFCSRCFLAMASVQIVSSVLFGNYDETFILTFVLLLFCLIISMYGIGHAFIKLHGTLPRIFFIGTSFYFVGSGLGFVFTTEIIENPFTNRIMKDWSFFTQTGILIEILFFTIGLTYRMRLVEMRKNNIEKELFYEKLKELEFQQNLMKQREHISHDLHDDVGSTLNSIAVYSEIVKQYVQQSSPEATQILNKICTASQDLISTLNDIVWAVNPKNDHFENITLRMRLFAADLLMNRNVKIDFEADERLNNVTLSIEKRKHFFLIYKEAVNNVYKYADCSELKVRIYDCTKNICMDIMDDGKGFDHHKNSDGNGLHTMDERAKLLGGDIEIKTSPGNGCKMSLCFPIV